MGKLTAKSLTEATAKKYGIEHIPELDFTDDGTRFTVWVYKNTIPMSCARAGGETYLAIRPDYISAVAELGKSSLRFDMPYSIWIDVPERRTCDKFNGVDEFVWSDLCEACREVTAAVQREQKKFDEMNIPSDGLEELLQKEIDDTLEMLKEWNAKFDWKKANSYQLDRFKTYEKSLMESVEEAKETIGKINDGSIEKDKLWHMVDQKSRQRPLAINTIDGFYFNELKNSIKAA